MTKGIHPLFASIISEGLTTMVELRSLSLKEALDLHEILVVKYENEKRQTEVHEAKMRADSRRGRR